MSVIIILCGMCFVVMYLFLITIEYVIVRHSVVNSYDVQHYGENKNNSYHCLCVWVCVSVSEQNVS